MKTKFLVTAVLFVFAVLNTGAQTINQKSVKFESPETAVLVGEEGLAMRTTNSGDNWTILTTNVTTPLNSNDFYSYQYEETTVNIHIAVGNDGVIIKSTDDGATWETKTSGTTENLNDVFILNGMLTAACGNNGTLLYSPDLGETWMSVPTGMTEHFNDILFIEGDDKTVSREVYLSQLTGVMASNNGMLTSAGLRGTWVNNSGRGLEMNLNSVSHLSGDVLFAAGSAGLLMRSTDRGATWETIASSIKENIHEIKFIDNNTVAASCDNGIIIKSTDAGASWGIVETPTTNNLYAVNFWSAAFGISVGENGIELYTTDAGVTWIEKESIGNKNGQVNTFSVYEKAADTKDIILNQNYPNPFNPSTVISYSVPFDAFVSVKIYDMTGKEVRTLVNGQVTGGTYSVSFNASNLASGIYFYVLRASSGVNEMTKTMRMILTK